MGKQHNTFPGEQPEMPVPKEVPEVNQPKDPKVPEIPEENPERVPDELPQIGNLPEKKDLRGTCGE